MATSGEDLRIGLLASLGLPFCPFTAWLQVSENPAVAWGVGVVAWTGPPRVTARNDVTARAVAPTMASARPDGPPLHLRGVSRAMVLVPALTFGAPRPSAPRVTVGSARRL